MLTDPGRAYRIDRNDVAAWDSGTRATCPRCGEVTTDSSRFGLIPGCNHFVSRDAAHPFLFESGPEDICRPGPALYAYRTVETGDTAEPVATGAFRAADLDEAERILRTELRHDIEEHERLLVRVWALREVPGEAVLANGPEHEITLEIPVWEEDE